MSLPVDGSTVGVLLKQNLESRRVAQDGLQFLFPASAFAELSLQRLVAMTALHWFLHNILTYTEMTTNVRWCRIVTFCRQRQEDCQLGN